MDLNLCKRLIEACCPDLPIRKIAPNSEGWVYFVAEVNDEYIFRFPRGEEADRDLNYEIALLPHLATCLPLSIPQLEFICKGNKGYPWQFVGYPKIPGTPLTKPFLDATDPHKPARQLGAFLTQLHNYSVKKAKQAQVRYFNADQWRTFYKTFYQQVKEKIFPVLSKDLQDKITKSWNAFLTKDQHFQFQSVLIHRDLGEEHILWDQKQECITGIIDWNDVSIGDPAIDFTGILDCYGDAFTETVLTHYQRSLDPTFLDRAEFYMKIGWCHCILYAQMIEDQQLLEESINQLDEYISET